MFNISFTIDIHDKKALIDGANTLLSLAGETMGAVPQKPADFVIPDPDIDASEVFGSSIDQGVAVTAPDDAVEVTPPGGVVVDINGIPWDARIHSAKKTQTKDGVWREKRGVDSALVAKITGELKAVMAIPAAPNLAAPQISGDLAPATVIEPKTIPAPPDEPVQIPTPPVTNEYTGPKTYAEFLKACAAKMSSAQISMDRINEIVAGHGVIGGLQALSARPDLIPQIWVDIDGL